MRASLLFLVLMAGLTLTDPPVTMTDFVPKDIAHAALIGCFIGGTHNNPDYAETFIIVRYGAGKPVVTEGGRADYTPIISRRSVLDGGVPHAIEDCRQWFADAKKQFEATAEAEKSSK